MKNIQDIIKYGKEKLHFITENPTLESEIILCNIINKNKVYIHTNANTTLKKSIFINFCKNIKERINKKPIAYILKKKEFWDISLFVNNKVLIPRPETELIIEIISNDINKKFKKYKILELGTGSGAISITLAKMYPMLNLYATDMSKEILDIASYNSHINKITNIQFIKSDWFSNINDKNFDFIICNPPYISFCDYINKCDIDIIYEPFEALVGGYNGFSSIRKIINEAKNFLNYNGKLIIEHGYDQKSIIKEIMIKNKYRKIINYKDINKLDRVSIGLF